VTFRQAHCSSCGGRLEPGDPPCPCQLASAERAGEARNVPAPGWREALEALELRKPPADPWAARRELELRWLPPR
jgi:hypothetical protein